MQGHARKYKHKRRTYTHWCIHKIAHPCTHTRTSPHRRAPRRRHLYTGPGCWLGVSGEFGGVAIPSVRGDLLVVHLQCCQVFPSFHELALLHTLADVVMDKSSLGEHQVELAVEAGPCLH